MPETALAQDSPPARIGRFEVVHELGRGAQGAVYLARDGHLDRNVALKTLSLAQIAPEDRPAMVRMLLDEARIVARLQHPNLVALHDAGEDRGTPYLVFEYVAGRTLAEVLRAEGRFPGERAALVCLGALRGIASAHAMHVLHRDIKPGNIMLAAGAVARVMDFGIARRSMGAEPEDAALRGTPSYMAPEYISSGECSEASDVFSMGVVLYELLTGRPPVRGGELHDTLERIVNEPVAPPSTQVADLDPRLEAIVMKALAKHPGERYPSAQAMADALERYLAPDASSPGPEETNGTIQFLLRRMRHRSDFPALSATIAAINRLAVSDREPTSALCDAILKDVALSAKLLKVVNTAYYKGYGEGIGTISRAVAILGFERVRGIATSLALLDHLQNRPQAADLLEDLSASYLAGIVSQQLVPLTGLRVTEEAYLCAIFHRLGRLLVGFYLHEEHEAVRERVRATGCDEACAAQEILGASYEDIGVAVARSWNFPPAVVASMQAPPQNIVPRPAGMAKEILSQDEIDALLQSVNGTPDSAAEDPEPQDGIRRYDLATQERIVRGRMPTLEIINDRFARLLRIGLFNMLRRSPEVSVGTVKTQKYSEFLRNLVVPTNLNLMQIKPLRGTSLFVFEPKLVFAIVDSMFGGSGQMHFRIEGRDFSHTEQRIIQRVLKTASEEYQKSWAPVHPLQFEHVRSEMHTQFANIATPSEIVVVSTFTVDLGTSSGDLYICIPYSTLEPIRDVLYSPVQGDHTEPDRRWMRMLSKQVQIAEVDLTASMAKIDTTMGQLVRMRVGDVIPFEREETIVAQVDGVPIFECGFGTSNSHYAIRIEKILAVPQHENTLGE